MCQVYKLLLWEQDLMIFLLRYVGIATYSIAMQIDIITLFPDIVMSPLQESIMKRAQSLGIVTITAHQLRDWANDKHKTTDDTLYGGGQGMLLKPEPLFAAIEELKRPNTKVILMTPQGNVFNQKLASKLSTCDHLLFVCGHYEGVDHRVVENLIDLELSIGDYVLTNGAIAAAVVCDAVVRLLPGALGNDQSSQEESFSNPNLLEAPAYTKPSDFRDFKVPDVLLSGNHAKIEEWRNQKAIERTNKNRPDLIKE
jgi:tRNA (guanine37-N1)-methyltransferase